MKTITLINSFYLSTGGCGTFSCAPVRHPGATAPDPEHHQQTKTDGTKPEQAAKGIPVEQLGLEEAERLPGSLAEPGQQVKQ